MTPLIERAIAAVESIGTNLGRIADAIDRQTGSISNVIPMRGAAEQESKPATPDAAKDEKPAATPKSGAKASAKQAAASKEEQTKEPEAPPITDDDINGPIDDGSPVSDAQAQEITGAVRGYYEKTDAAKTGRAVAKGRFDDLRKSFGVSKVAELPATRFEEFMAAVAAMKVEP